MCETRNKLEGEMYKNSKTYTFRFSRASFYIIYQDKMHKSQTVVDLATHKPKLLDDSFKPTILVTPLKSLTLFL